MFPSQAPALVLDEVRRDRSRDKSIDKSVSSKKSKKSMSSFKSK